MTEHRLGLRQFKSLLKCTNTVDIQPASKCRYYHHMHQGQQWHPPVTVVHHSEHQPSTQPGHQHILPPGLYVQNQPLQTTINSHICVFLTENKPGVQKLQFSEDYSSIGYCVPTVVQLCKTQKSGNVITIKLHKLRNIQVLLSSFA